jgi:hypothetical protein
MVLQANAFAVLEWQVGYFFQAKESTCTVKWGFASGVLGRIVERCRERIRRGFISSLVAIQSPTVIERIMKRSST